MTTTAITMDLAPPPPLSSANESTRLGRFLLLNAAASHVLAQNTFTTTQPGVYRVVSMVDQAAQC